MTRTERIEAAARAMHPRKMKDREYETLREKIAHDAQRLTCRMMAELALTAAFPELMSSPPSGWVAPWEATEAMWRAGDLECNADEEIELVYRAMRDAHLKPNP